MSISDPTESELTSLSESEEDRNQETVPPRKRGRSRKKREYMIEPALREPRTVPLGLGAAKDLIDRDRIDLDPEYQRDVVWPEAKMVGFIGSLLENYFIPQIVFARYKNSRGQAIRTCIDGKQRLTSIKRFMDGEIPYKDTRLNKKFYFKANEKGARSRRALLPPEIVEDFKMKQIMCAEYDDISDEQQREIFNRVQNGVALMPAERVQSLPGPMATWLHEIHKKNFGPNGLLESLDLEHKEKRHREYLWMAYAAFAIAKQREKAKKWVYPDNPRLIKWVEEFIPDDGFKDALLKTYDVYLELARDPEHKKAFVPLSRRSCELTAAEFIMIGVLIYLHNAKLGLESLSVGILRMREFTRDRIPASASVHKSTLAMFTFIRDEIPRLVKPESRQLLASASHATIAVGPPPPPSTSRARSKRKAIASNDGGESDAFDEDELADEPPLRRPRTAALVSQAKTSAALAQEVPLSHAARKRKRSKSPATSGAAFAGESPRTTRARASVADGAGSTKDRGTHEHGSGPPSHSSSLSRTQAEPTSSMTLTSSTIHSDRLRAVRDAKAKVAAMQAHGSKPPVVEPLMAPEAMAQDPAGHGAHTSSYKDHSQQPIPPQSMPEGPPQLNMSASVQASSSHIAAQQFGSSSSSSSKPVGWDGQASHPSRRSVAAHAVDERRSSATRWSDSRGTSAGPSSHVPWRRPVPSSSQRRSSPSRPADSADRRDDQSQHDGD